MDNAHSKTPLGLIGYACQVKTKATMLFFHAKKNMGNAPNSLWKSQILFSLVTSENVKKWENAPLKTPLG